jgi:arabinofuranosyltransferase
VAAQRDDIVDASRAGEPASKRPAGADSRPSGRAWGALLWLALAGFAALVAWKAWVADDAYITLRTIDNALHGYGLRWNIDERVQSYTHPLWMLLLAAAIGVTRDSFFTTMAAGALVSCAAAAVVAFRIAPTRRIALIAIATLAFSRSFTDYSTSGLENPLTHLLLAGFVAVHCGPDVGGRRVLLSNRIAALLAITRLDALWLILPVLAVDLWAGRRRVRWRILGLAWLPFLVWEGFSLVYYGFPLPNTAYAKLGNDFGLRPLVGQGLWYVFSTAVDDPLTLAATLAGVAAALWRGEARWRALALGVLVHLVYVVQIGGDFMAGRFFTAPLLVGVALLARCGLVWRHVQAVAALVLAGLCFTSVAPWRAVHVANPLAYDLRGVADERLVYDACCSWFGRQGDGPWPNPIARRQSATLRANWERDGFVRVLMQSGVLADGDDLGADVVGREPRPLVVRGGVGYLGYFLGPRVHVLDFHALSEPLLARLPAEQRDPLPEASISAGGRSWRIGHFIRRIPKGYPASLVRGSNQLEDPDLASYYDDLSLVTRGPLLSRRRAEAILKLNRPGRDPRIVRFVARRAAAHAPGD